MPKRVGFLYDKMLDRAFIKETILLAARGKHKRYGVRRVLDNLDGYTEKLYAMLRAGLFTPSTPNERQIYDVGSRKWRTIQTVPFFPDGVVHWLLVRAMQPVLMRGMYHWSCASIPGRGTARTRQHIERTMRRDPAGTTYAAELDVRRFYPSIPTDRLMDALRHKIKDERFLALVEAVVRSCGGGLAIGYYICQWLANFYLEPLDHYICTLDGVKYYDRYMDNLTLRGASKRKLHRARALIEVFLRERLGLTLKASWQIYRTRHKRRTAERHAALDARHQRLRRARMVCAVGYRYSRTHTLLRKPNLLRLTRSARRIAAKLARGQPVPRHMAAGFVSRAGQLRHCDSQGTRRRYIDRIIRTAKEAIRHGSTWRQQAAGAARIAA